MSPPRSSWIAVVLALLLAAFFAYWAREALANGPLQQFDNEVALGWKDAATGHHVRRQVMVGFTIIGSVPAMIGLATAGLLWQLTRRDWTLAIAWALIVVGGGLLNYTLKKSFDRPRPPAEWRDEAVRENNESFPSGHSMGSMIGYGMLAFALTQSIRRREVKFFVFLVIAIVIGMIGFSRIYLRAHWFSDVIGGFTIGVAWLMFGLACVQWLRLPRSTPA